MTLNDEEEVLPLLHHKRTESESNILYHSNRTNKRSLLKRRPGSRDDDPAVGETPLDGATSLWGSGTQTRLSQFRSNRLSPTQKIVYTWTNLNVYGSEKNKKSIWKKMTSLTRDREVLSDQPKHILKNAYGIAHPGEILAIVGSSGAGKTTLLNALTFRSGSSNIVKGSRYLNGRPINNKNVITKFSAYVEQDNLFLGTLTVKEHLIFQALVRIGRDVSYRQKLKRVEDVVAELGLEKCQNTIIGTPGRRKGISGGEMKRLSFASEVLTNPPLMFCDEPTSGLDSFIALNVITVLKSMSIRGKTVICTIHQPTSEIFSLFDKILVLAEGRTAFLGKPNDAVSFFADLGASPLANYNPADFFIQLLAVIPGKEEACKKTIKIVCDSFDDSPFGLEIATRIECETQNQAENNCKCFDPVLSGDPEEFTYPASWFLQFRALFWRSWISIIKEPLLVKVRLFQTVVLSLVVGLIYHQQKLNEDGVMNINGVLFTFLTNMTFQNLFAVISVFCSELPIFMKEQSSKMYRVDAYFLSKTLAEIPMFLVIPFIFTSITYYWINLNPKLEHFAIAVLILILVTNVATSFGYFISCVSTNVVMALSMGPPVIIPFLLFGGYLLNTRTVPTYFKWLSYLSWFKYGNEALLVNQWSDIEKIECNKSNVTCPATGEIVLEIYHFEKGNLWWDLTSLLILILLFRTVAFSALAFRAWRYQKRSR